MRVLTSRAEALQYYPPTDDDRILWTRGLILRDTVEVCLCQDLPSVNCADTFPYTTCPGSPAILTVVISSYHAISLCLADEGRGSTWVTIETAIMPCHCDSARAWNITSVMNLPQLAREMPTQSDLFSKKTVPEVTETPYAYNNSCSDSSRHSRLLAYQNVTLGY